MTPHADGVVARAPGKLYIAGEYAVVEPGHRAVLVAVNRFITLRITPCSPTGGYAGTIRSQLYDTGSRPWRHRPQDGLAEAVGGDDDYVISAIRVVEALVAEGGGRLGSFNLGISSELDEADGRKLGLGSSAAVTVATVRAVAGFYGLSLDDSRVYKLAMLASDAVQPIGSGGDIAASASRGADDVYSSFLRASQDTLASLTTAIEDDDAGQVMSAITRNRVLLVQLGRISGRVIETPELTRLVEIARDHGAAAKSSGAGGGDCGIALCPPDKDIAAMSSAWRAASIQPLDLAIYTHDSPVPPMEVTS